MRRAIGLGGATFVAVGAALALTLPASAHTPTIGSACLTNGKSELTIDLKDYQSTNNKKNTVEAKTQDGEILVVTKFDTKVHTTIDVDGSKAENFTVTVTAQDDPNGTAHGPGSPNGQWDGPFYTSTKVCPEGGGSSTTAPPPTTTTTPPTHTTTKPPTTTTAPPTTVGATTTTAVVAAATTTGAGTLPFTGVNATFPLLIAGVLVIAGGGILLWLRLAARRRRTES
jgi:hypothetical protein